MLYLSKSKLALCLIAFGLFGCGAIYTSPQVRDNDAAITEVEVIPFTLQSIDEANRSPYAARTLPVAFSNVARTGSVNSERGLPTPPLAISQPSRQPEERLLPALRQSPYQLGAGDRLRIAGPAMQQATNGPLGRTEAQTTYTIQSNGNIVLPDLGALEIGGLTLPEANSRLSQALRTNQLDPNFAFEINEFNARKVFVDGAVGSPVAVPLTFEPLTLQAALVAAGGARVAEREFATVRILRDSELYAIPLRRLNESAISRLLLADGDSIYVDAGYDLEAAQAYFRDSIERRQLTAQLRRDALNEISALANLERGSLTERRELFQQRLELGAVSRDYVYLVGEVGQARSIPLPFETRIALANVLFSDVTLPIQTADLSHIYVVRISPQDASIRAYHLDGTNAVNLAFAAHFEMRPNDLIFVAEQRVTAWSRVISQLSPTLFTSAANGI